MAKIRYYLDTRNANKEGKYPLKISVRHNDSRFYINLSVSLTDDQWNGSEVINAPLQKKMNAYIKQRYAEIETKLYDLRIAGKLEAMSAKSLKQIITTPDSPEKEEEPFFSAYFEKYLQHLSKKNTLLSFKYTANKISAYTDLDSLTFRHITPSWLKNFDSFMEKQGLSVNARGVYMRNIRAVFNAAIDDELIDIALYPFRRFKIKKKETIKRSLTPEQLVGIRDFASADPFAKEAADIFMLTFYLIGINNIDLLKLTEGTNGRIEYERSKTGRNYSIEVLPPAMELIQKYKGTKNLLYWGDQFTDYRNFTKKINKAYKIIGASIGIPTLTLYYARHTWATIAAALDIPKETIAAALGHGSATVTDIYINFDAKKVDLANRKVIEYIESLKKR